MYPRERLQALRLNSEMGRWPSHHQPCGYCSLIYIYYPCKSHIAKGLPWIWGWSKRGFTTLQLSYSLNSKCFPGQWFWGPVVRLFSCVLSIGMRTFWLWLRPVPETQVDSCQLTTCLNFTCFACQTWVPYLRKFLMWFQSTVLYSLRLYFPVPVC